MGHTYYYERDGIRFHHPTDWTLEAEEDADGGWSVTVHSPDAAFLLVSLRPDADNPAELVDRALDTLRGEYKELDAENALETIAGQAAIGHDIDFLTLDVAVTCRTRCVQTPVGPLLLMTQTSEFESARTEPVLRAIVASLQIDEE